MFHNPNKIRKINWRFTPKIKHLTSVFETVLRRYHQITKLTFRKWFLTVDGRVGDFHRQKFKPVKPFPSTWLFPMRTVAFISNFTQINTPSLSHVYLIYKICFTKVSSTIHKKECSSIIEIVRPVKFEFFYHSKDLGKAIIFYHCVKALAF